MASDSVKTTKYPEIGYVKVYYDVWRFVDMETRHVVGQQYTTKQALMDDLDRFASEFGVPEAKAVVESELQKLRTENERLLEGLSSWRATANESRAKLAAAEKLANEWRQYIYMAMRLIMPGLEHSPDGRPHNLPAAVKRLVNSENDERLKRETAEKRVEERDERIKVLEQERLECPSFQHHVQESKKRVAAPSPPAEREE